MNFLEVLEESKEFRTGHKEFLTELTEKTHGDHREVLQIFSVHYVVPSVTSARNVFKPTDRGKL
jgi:hypothetical protein